MFPVIRRHRQALRGLVPATAFALLAASASADRFPVVLANGTVMEASSRPFIGMGQVSFLDLQGRPQALASARVDVAATRQATRVGGAQSRVWTGDRMSALRGGVQFVGEASGDEPAESTDATAPVEIGSDVDRLRDRISQIDVQIRALPTKDRQRTLLIVQQLELQEELMRRMSVPADRS